MGQKGTQRRGHKPKASTDYNTNKNLPPLEYQLRAFGLNMTPEEIIEHGTLEQKERLVFVCHDYSRYFNTDAISDLGNRAKSSMVASFKSKKDLDHYNRCANEIDSLIVYSKQTLSDFTAAQAEFGKLATLLTKWEGYDKEAQRHTALLFSLRNTTFWIGKRENKKKLYQEEAVEEEIKKALRFTPFDGAELRYNEEKQEFLVDVDIEGGLYSQILEAAQRVAKALADYKARMVAAEEYIKHKSLLKYWPIDMIICYSDMSCEGSFHVMVKNDAYYKSALNFKRQQGETITKDDERRAVIPDYEELEPNEAVLKDCQKSLSKINADE